MEIPEFSKSYVLFRQSLECCTLRKNVPKTEFSKYNIEDKNDIPIIAGAVHESAVLITEDSMLKDEAKKYIESATPSEALTKIR